MTNQLFNFAELQKIDKLYFAPIRETDHAKENQQRKIKRLKNKSKNESNKSQQTHLYSNRKLHYIYTARKV